MPLYEHVCMARQDVSSQRIEEMTAEFQKIITDGGGKITKSEYWGVKPLAYKISKNRKAHYSLMNIDAAHEFVAEMERQMSLSSDILRFITLKVDQHEDGPSAMMRKSDRDDRRGGPGGGRRFGGPGGGRRDDGPRGDRDRGDRDRGDRNRGDRDNDTRSASRDKPAASEGQSS